MEETLLGAISTTGFPIALSCYLLIRLQKSLDAFAKQLEELIGELRLERLQPRIIH